MTLGGFGPIPRGFFGGFSSEFEASGYVFGRKWKGFLEEFGGIRLTGRILDRFRGFSLEDFGHRQGSGGGVSRRKWNGEG